MIDIFDKRQSTRCYSNKKILNEDIKKILLAGSKAPSAHNKQPWYFVVLTTKQKNKIGDLLINYDIINNTISSNTKTGEIIKQAPTLILIYSKINTHLEMTYLSLGAAIENMLLKATEININSLWIGNVINIKKEIKNDLNIDKLLVSAVALGIKEKEEKQIEKQKLEDNLLWMEDICKNQKEHTM